MIVVDATAARKWTVVGALAIGALMVSLDFTVLSLAMPTLTVDLHASTAQLQWIADAYLLVVAATLLPAGIVGDWLGRRSVLLAGLAIFGMSSAAAAYAKSSQALIAARIGLGLGAAAIFTLSFAVVPVLFSAAERARAVTVLAGVAAVAFPVGPILGGWLLTQFWWGSVFLINVPVMVAVFAITAMFLPESRAATRPQLDLGGALLSSVGLATLTYGLIKAGERSWSDPAAEVTVSAGTAALMLFVAWERRINRRGGAALVDLGLFRSASFTWGTILTTAVSFPMFGLLFAVPQYFQAVVGADAMGAGVRLLPIAAGVLVGAAVADRLTRQAGPKRAVALGFALMAAGLAVGTQSAADSRYQFVAVWITILGVGLGLALPTSAAAAMTTLTAEGSGMGTGVLLAVRQVGGTLGVATLGSIVNSVFRGHVDVTGLPPQAAALVRSSVSAGVAVAERLRSASLLQAVRSAYVSGMDLMLWVSAFASAVSIVLAVAFLPRRSGPTEQVATTSAIGSRDGRRQAPIAVSGEHPPAGAVVPSGSDTSEAKGRRPR